MSWLRKHRWRSRIIVIGVSFLSALLALFFVQTVGAQEGTSDLSVPGTITMQATPTANPTISAETAQQELIQLQRENDRSLQAWIWSNVSSLLATLVVVGGGLIGLFRWLGDRKSEREKQADERFQKALESLVSKEKEVRAGAAIRLLAFLQKGKTTFAPSGFFPEHLPFVITAMPTREKSTTLSIKHVPMIIAVTLNPGGRSSRVEERGAIFGRSKYGAGRQRTAHTYLDNGRGDANTCSRLSRGGSFYSANDRAGAWTLGFQQLYGSHRCATSSLLPCPAP